MAIAERAESAATNKPLVVDDVAAAVGRYVEDRVRPREIMTDTVGYTDVAA